MYIQKILVSSWEGVFNKQKRITYYSSVWNETEKHFGDVSEAKAVDINLQSRPHGDRIFLSNICSNKGIRYNCFHALTFWGDVKLFTGVNLDEECDVLMDNFPKLETS